MNDTLDRDHAADGRLGGRPRLQPGERTVPVTVLLPESQEAALRREAAARGLSLSARVRESLGERAAVLAWLRSGWDRPARGSVAWEALVGDLLREVAESIEAGEHRR